MRLLFPVAIAIAATAPAQAAPIHRAPPLPHSQCPRPSSQFAGNPDHWRGNRLKPRRLAELPPAEAYAAMLRTDAQGCMVAVKYREVRH